MKPQTITISSKEYSDLLESNEALQDRVEELEGMIDAILEYEEDDDRS